MANDNYNEVCVRFTPEQKERDIYIIGGRLVGQDGVFLIHGENGACLMIPKEAVSYVVCGPAKSIQFELDDSNPSCKRAIYDLRKETSE